MSHWDDLNMDTKISQILAVESHDPAHHFGRPFLTPYQIAIAFENRYPQDFQTIGKPLGEKVTAQQDFSEVGQEPQGSCPTRCIRSENVMMLCIDCKSP